MMTYEELNKLKSLVDDICVLTNFKGKERYMTQNEKMCREATYQRVKNHGQTLAEIEVARREHSRLKMSIAALEIMFPEVKK